MYIGNNLDNYDKGRLMLMLQVRQLKLSNLTSLPCLFRHIIRTLHFFYFRGSFISVNEVIPIQLPIKGVLHVQGCDLLLGDHVCEKSDVLKCIDYP